VEFARNGNANKLFIRLFLSKLLKKLRKAELKKKLAQKSMRLLRIIPVVLWWAA